MRIHAWPLRVVAPLALSGGILALALSFTPGPGTPTVVRLAFDDGATASDEGGLRVDPLPRSRQATALSPPLALSADQIAHAVVKTSGETPELSLYFLWKGQGPTTRGVPLQWSGPGLFSVDLRGLEGWSGSVGQVGLGVHGPLERTVWVRSLDLTPPGRAFELRQLLRDWSSFEGLHGYSMNFVRGSSPHVPQKLPVVPAVALWVGLAIGIHLAHAAWTRRLDGPVVAAIVAVGWLTLDLRWQADLARQLELTRDRYQGRSWSERQERAEDGRLFLLARSVATQLPAEPQDLFVLTRDPADTSRFLSVRMRYLLLPHRARVSRPTPPPDAPAGGYVLVFAPRDDVEYDGLAGRLSWRVAPDGAWRGRPARQLRSDADVALYRLD